MSRERRIVYWMVSPAFFVVFAFTFTLAENVRPVTVVRAKLVAGLAGGAPPGLLAAAALVAALPPIVLFLVFRSRILSGLTSDALDNQR